MFAIQISDCSTFVRQAKKLGVPVQVVRTATVVPVQRSGAVIMHPAVAIDYTIEFEDASTGPTQWRFREVVEANEHGEVQLSESLLNMLNTDPKATNRFPSRRARSMPAIVRSTSRARSKCCTSCAAPC